MSEAVAWASLGTTVLCNVHAGMTPRDAVTTAVRHITAMQVWAALSSEATRLPYSSF
jgi:hypothetical protein